MLIHLGQLVLLLVVIQAGRAALTWGIVTALFGLWHLGYVDAIVLATAQQSAPPLGVIMAFKVIIGLAVGLLASFACWRTGRVYGAFLLHALWNMFGR